MATGAPCLFSLANISGKCPSCVANNRPLAGAIIQLFTPPKAPIASIIEIIGSIQCKCILVKNKSKACTIPVINPCCSWSCGTIKAIDKGPNEMFKGMSVYAENPNYVNILSSVYRDRIEPVFQTENFLLPKRKPITEQMDSLQ